jgi:Zn-dependent protease
LPAGVDAVAFWVGQMNVSLLIFNLLPAFPLDGGRVLRAVIWARRGDYLSATVTAARLGRRFGQSLVAVGLLLAILLGAFVGVWLAFIGWFLLAAADGELAAALARRGMVARLVVPDLYTARRW